MRSSAHAFGPRRLGPFVGVGTGLRLAPSVRMNSPGSPRRISALPVESRKLAPRARRICCVRSLSQSATTRVGTSDGGRADTERGDGSFSTRTSSSALGPDGAMIRIRPLVAARRVTLVVQPSGSAPRSHPATPSSWLMRAMRQGYPMLSRSRSCLKQTTPSSGQNF